MKLKLRTKLLIGFITVALIGSVIGGVGIYGIRTIDDADTVLYEKMTIPLSYLIQMTESFQRVRINIRDFADAQTPADRKTFSDNIVTLQASEAEASAKYKQGIIDPKGLELYQVFEKADAEYKKDLVDIQNLFESKKEVEGRALMSGRAKATALAAQAAIDALVTFKTGLAEQIDKQNSAAADFVTLLMLASMAAGLLVSVFLAIWLGVFMVSRPLMKISDTLAAGSGQIRSASNQLSTASQEIANGATEQASSIEETSSSMEELSSMVKQNLTNAKEASILADRAAESSTTGYAQMERMLESMNEINKSSDKIKKIIKVIDDIAFQTNILALNAAVEAARAGEAGMGFAVVADEVKNLANRSAEAAKETAEMIEDSLHKTSAGLDIATKMSEVFKDILTTAKKVSEMSREVETASRQQDTGIEQTNKAIVQFDAVVQTNAATAEETASAAEELQSQVESLNDIVAGLLKLVTGKESASAKVSASHPTEHKVLQHPQTRHLAAPSARTSPRSREVAPEQLIPFEDDEDLKHLK